MKHCIWCLKTELEATFSKLAHTIPQSLGSKSICENVCDNCNSYFGTHQNGNPSIETIFKETFNISRAILLGNNEIGKNKTIPRYKSEYFQVNFEKRKLKLNSKYRYSASFQRKLGRLIKRGFYKIFLEEMERQYKSGHSRKFNFIREFARYDIGDYPVFYFNRSSAVIVAIDELLKNPEFLMYERKLMNYLVADSPAFVEFEFMGHVFGVVTSREWELLFDQYKVDSMTRKSKYFKSMIEVTKFNDIDIALSIFKDK